MDRPIVIKNVISDELFDDLYETLHIHTRWCLNNSSYTGATPSWGSHKSHNFHLIFFEVGAIIKLKIQRHIRKNIRLCKIHCNAQTSGQISEFHKDFWNFDTWTFVLFTQPQWSTQWGGEFVSQHPDTKEYFYTPYIPNSGALIPGYWEHYGQSPNGHTHNVRTTMAFSYMEENLFQIKLMDDRQSYSRYT